MNVQADLNLHWAFMKEGLFSDIAGCMLFTRSIRADMPEQHCRPRSDADRIALIQLYLDTLTGSKMDFSSPVVLKVLL